MFSAVSFPGAVIPPALARVQARQSAPVFHSARFGHDTLPEQTVILSLPKRTHRQINDLLKYYDTGHRKEIVLIALALLNTIQHAYHSRYPYLQVGVPYPSKVTVDFFADIVDKFNPISMVQPFAPKALGQPLLVQLPRQWVAHAETMRQDKRLYQFASLDAMVATAVNILHQGARIMEQANREEALLDIVIRRTEPVWKTLATRAKWMLAAPVDAPLPNHNQATDIDISRFFHTGGIYHPLYQLPVR